MPRILVNDSIINNYIDCNLKVGQQLDENVLGRIFYHDSTNESYINTIWMHAFHLNMLGADVGNGSKLLAEESAGIESCIDRFLENPPEDG